MVKFINTVGDIVGASVEAQIGSLPSISSGGWQDSKSGLHMQPKAASSHSASVSNAMQLQSESVLLSIRVIP